MAAAKATGGVLHGPKRSDHTREEEECSEWYSFFFPCFTLYRRDDPFQSRYISSRLREALSPSCGYMTDSKKQFGGRTRRGNEITSKNKNENKKQGCKHLKHARTVREIESSLLPSWPVPPAPSTQSTGGWRPWRRTPRDNPRGHRKGS